MGCIITGSRWPVVRVVLRAMYGYLIISDMSHDTRQSAVATAHWSLQKPGHAATGTAAHRVTAICHWQVNGAASGDRSVICKVCNEGRLCNSH